MKGVGDDYVSAGRPRASPLAQGNTIRLVRASTLFPAAAFPAKPQKPKQARLPPALATYSRHQTDSIPPFLPEQYRGTIHGVAMLERSRRSAPILPSKLVWRGTPCMTSWDNERGEAAAWGGEVACRYQASSSCNLVGVPWARSRCGKTIISGHGRNGTSGRV